MKINKFGIHIKTKDFNKSFKFYKDFGFKAVFAYGPDDFISRFSSIDTASEKYRGITYQIGDALLELGEDHIAIKKEVFQETITSSKVSAMVDVSSVSDVRKICEENDYEIAKSEVDYPWGTRELVIKDPDGFIIVFREFIQ